jgi:hypothetical protein
MSPGRRPRCPTFVINRVISGGRSPPPSVPTRNAVNRGKRQQRVRGRRNGVRPSPIWRSHPRGTHLAASTAASRFEQITSVRSRSKPTLKPSLCASKRSDRIGKGRREAREQSVVCARVVGIELCEGDCDKTGRLGEDPQRAEHRLELQPSIARGMLRERCVGEVDDVDVEMDDLAIGLGRKEFERLTCCTFWIVSDVLQSDASQPESRSHRVRTVSRPSGYGRRGRPGWRRATGPCPPAAAQRRLSSLNGLPRAGGRIQVGVQVEIRDSKVADC